MNPKEWDILGRQQRHNLLIRVGVKKGDAERNAKSNYEFIDEDVKMAIAGEKVTVGDLMTKADIRYLGKEQAKTESEYRQTVREQQVRFSPEDNARGARHIPDIRERLGIALEQAKKGKVLEVLKQYENAVKMADSAVELTKAAGVPIKWLENRFEELFSQYRIDITEEIDKWYKDYYL